MAKKTNINPMEDKVRITVTPPTMDDEGKAFYVSVGPYNATIKYGEEVEVPRFVASALENQKIAIAEKKKNEAKRQKNI